MNNQNPLPEPVPQVSSQPGSFSNPNRSWREQRQAKRIAWSEARREIHAGRPYFWLTGGSILIMLGVVFMLQNMGIPFLTNWWALFILIPALWVYVAAWNSYQDNGRLTRSGIGSLIMGIMLTILAMVFLLNLNLGLFWPILLIVGGLIFLVTALFPA